MPEPQGYYMYNYITNRFLAKTHVVSTNTPKGEWSEWDWRMFHACFNILVDFVETDLCGMSQKHNGQYRDPVGGLDVLDWESTLKFDDEFFCNNTEEIERAKSKNTYGKPTPQAIKAIKQKQLYMWYKYSYDENTPEEVMQEKFEELARIRESLWC